LTKIPVPAPYVPPRFASTSPAPLPGIPSADSRTSLRRRLASPTATAALAYDAPPGGPRAARSLCLPLELRAPTSMRGASSGHQVVRRPDLDLPHGTPCRRWEIVLTQVRPPTARPALLPTAAGGDLPLLTTAAGCGNARSTTSPSVTARPSPAWLLPPDAWTGSTGRGHNQYNACVFSCS
jgi:hypothetical protein